MEEINVCQEISFPEEINVEYEKLIKHLREIWGPGKIKQKDLAEAAGVNKSSLNQFIKNGRVPSFEILFKLIYAHTNHPPICLNPTCKYSQEAIYQIKSILSCLP